MDLNNISYISVPEGRIDSIHEDSTQLWERVFIYGIDWNGSTSPTMTRTDDSELFSTPVIGNGTTLGNSPFDNRYPWKDIAVETIDDNVLVKIPKFWYKWIKSGSTLKLQIGSKPFAGFKVSPMHADRGDGKGERDYAYIGKYKSGADYRSKSNVAPLSSKTITQMRTGIANIGDGYYQQDFASFWTLRMLFLIEYATWDGQSILANTTNFSSLSSILTGGTSNMTYHTGISANGYSIQYRYVEDPWENLLEWIDGLYFSGTNVYIINNPNKFAIGSNGTLVGSRPTGEGYIKNWAIPNNSGYEWALIPSEVTSTEGYVYDEYYYASTGTVAYVGGTRSSWGAHGPFFIYTDFTGSSTSASITSRLMKLP